MFIKKWQKYLVFIVVAPAVLLLAAILIARSMVDEAYLKAQVHEKIAQITGSKLQLAHLHLSFSPLPQLQAEDIQLNNPSWAHDSFMFKAKTIDADIAFIPLLRGKIEIKGVTVKGAQVKLEVSPEGKYNWESLFGTQGTEDVSAFFQKVRDMALTSLSIQDSTISMRHPNGSLESWQVKNMAINSGRGLRNIQLATQLVHEQQELELDGKIDDLSRLNEVGASTQASVKLKIGQALATIDGTFPLDQAATNFNLHIVLDVSSLKDVYAFLGRPYQSNAALKGEVHLYANKQKIQLKNFNLALGEMHASGHGTVDRTTVKPRFDMQVQTDKVDMVQIFIDAGRPPLPPKPDGELVHDNPLPWYLLTAMQGTQGELGLQIASLKLRSGIAVSDARAKATFDGDQMHVGSFSGKLLQGEAHGDAVFDGSKKSVQFALHMDDVLLGEWQKQNGTHIKVDGGKMQIDMHIQTNGNSMKSLLASVNGPVDIRIGSAVIQSPQAGNAEYWLTGLFSAKNASRVNMACASGHLDFRAGVAKGQGIVGARSDVSQLLTSGYIDMRNETLDLRGRIRARSGVSLGLSNLAGDVKVAGKLTKPALQLDESGVMGTLARVGAAILTSGVSIIATSIWDGANPESDPCQIVFASK